MDRVKTETYFYMTSRLGGVKRVSTVKNHMKALIRHNLVLRMKSGR